MSSANEHSGRRLLLSNIIILNTERRGREGEKEGEGCRQVSAEEKTRHFTEREYAKKGKVLPYLRLVSSIILGLGLRQLTISSFFFST